MHVAIVGGGISGLSTAYYLAKAGVSSTLIEKRPRLGGVIQTEQIDGCLVEAGPDSFLAAKPWAMDLIRELGLEGEVIGSNDHLRKTFIRKGGRMVPMPDGLQFLVPTRIAPILTTPLFSWTTKARMAEEWFRPRPTAPRRDCSVSEFVVDHYGQEVVDYLAEPLLAGVYGGAPETLSVSSVLPRFVELESKYGSLSRGMLAERRAAATAQPIFQTLRSGLGSLVGALQGSIETHARTIHGEVEAIERTATGYRLWVSGEWVAADRVALACESHASARLVGGIDPQLAQNLTAIPYTSSTVVALGFEPANFPKALVGFGFLVPRRERRRLVACTFMGTKFNFRASDNRILLRCFLSGAHSGDSNLLTEVLNELREIIGLTGEPLFTRIYSWPLSMAQYTVGHQERITAIELRLRSNPGLYLASNAFYGVGIPDCVRLGKQIAERVVN